MWNNEYWPLLIQAYLAKPEGIKSQWSRTAVDLAMELHLRPTDITDRLKTIDAHNSAPVERLLQHYKAHPRRLLRDTERLRHMSGFGDMAAFYDGVSTATHKFEALYRPVGGTPFTPAMLTILLDLYFRLVPTTMVDSTPEVRDMAQRTGLTADQVVEALHIFLFIAPAARKGSDDELAAFSPLTPLCNATWHRLDNGNPAIVAQEARRYYEYYIAPVK